MRTCYLSRVLKTIGKKYLVNDEVGMFLITFVELKEEIGEQWLYKNVKVLFNQTKKFK